MRYARPLCNSRTRHALPEALLLSVALALGLGWTPAVGDTAATPAAPQARTLMIEIEEALVCQCGCGLTVHACNHLNCPSGVPIKEEIAARVAQGETKAQILAYFQGRYGEKVLSAPTLRGFNLVAWIAPVVFVALGGVLVAVVARRWTRQTAAHVTSGPQPALLVPPDDPVRARLAREIRDFDG